MLEIIGALTVTLGFLSAIVKQIRLESSLSIQEKENKEVEK
jgi:hypothetical protein